MNQKTTFTVSRISTPAAKIALFGSITFLVILALLHIIKPEVTPTWQTLSIYARGNFGWIMQINYAILGITHAALFFAIKSQVKNIYGRIGLGFLVIASIGAVFAGIGVSDPMNTAQAAMTPSGQVHSIGAALAVWGAPIAAILINLSLVRKNPLWASMKKPLLWTIAVPFIGLVLFIGTAHPDSPYGPGDIVGLMNRVVIIAILAWQITVAHSALALGKETL